MDDDVMRVPEDIGGITLELNLLRNQVQILNQSIYNLGELLDEVRKRNVPIVQDVALLEKANKEPDDSALAEKIRIIRIDLTEGCDELRNILNSLDL